MGKALSIHLSGSKVLTSSATAHGQSMADGTSLLRTVTEKILIRAHSSLFQALELLWPNNTKKMASQIVAVIQL